MVTLMKKQKAEPKPVNLDFPIPDYRQDKRYIEAAKKLVDLRDRAQQLQTTIEAIRNQRSQTGVDFLARKLLAGESVQTPSPDEKLNALYAELRVVKKAIEIMEPEADKVRFTVCAELAKDPELIARVDAVFRKTGQVMEDLYVAMKNEAALLNRLRSAGLASGRGGCGKASWTEHKLFASWKTVSLDNASNPLREYLAWNRQNFGTDAK